MKFPPDILNGYDIVIKVRIGLLPNGEDEMWLILGHNTRKGEYVFARWISWAPEAWDNGHYMHGVSAEDAFNYFRSRWLEVPDREYC